MAIVNSVALFSGWSFDWVRQIYAVMTAGAGSNYMISNFPCWAHIREYNTRAYLGWRQFDSYSFWCRVLTLSVMNFNKNVLIDLYRVVLLYSEENSEIVIKMENNWKHWSLESKSLHSRIDTCVQNVDNFITHLLMMVWSTTPPDSTCLC